MMKTEAKLGGWLDRGGRHRKPAGETKMNRSPSRSHALFQMVIESRLPWGGAAEGDGAVLVSKLTVVDLAGASPGPREDPGEREEGEGGRLDQQVPLDARHGHQHALGGPAPAHPSQGLQAH